jgi:hypothetical protein
MHVLPLRGSHVACPSPSCFSRTRNPLRHVYDESPEVFMILFVRSFGPLVVVIMTFMPFCVFSISQLPYTVSSGREASHG